jgi:hypothetical protein
MRREFYDWPSRADERRRYFERIINTEYPVVRRRLPLRFLSCVLIVGVTAIILLWFAWPAEV